MDTATKVIRSKKGMVLVYVAIALMTLFAILGLAVDSGHLFTVRNELQNAADAAALKGAWHLYTRPPAPAVPTLQWDTAIQMARDMMAENRSDHSPLSDAVVDAGFWNMSSGILQPTTLPSPGIGDVAAVRVVTSRAEGSNGGPVGNFFMRLFGNEVTAVGSRPAVAVIGSPETMPAMSLFPMALSKCMTDHYFSQVPLPDPPPRIEISSPYLPGGETCKTGQWTSFLADDNDTDTIKELIYDGNPNQLRIGDDIWIEPGAKAALYSPITTDWLPDGGKDVIMAVVDTTGTDLSVKGELPITSFVAFHIDGAEGGSGKYVYGHFIGYVPAPPGAVPGGPPTTVLTLPVLVQ